MENLRWFIEKCEGCNLLHTDGKFIMIQIDIICIIFNESGQKLKNFPGFLKKFTIIH